MYNSTIETELIQTGFSFRQKGNELEFKECPFCRGGKSHDKYTFYVSKADGAYICHRGTCNAKGNWFNFCQRFNIPYVKQSLSVNTVIKTYEKPTNKTIPLSQKAIDYLKARGIGDKQLLDRWDIVSDAEGNIVFKYYQNEELVLTKTRLVATKGFFASKNSKPVFWGLDKVKDYSNLVIVEGELDAMAVSLVYDSVVSVPFGVNNTECFTTCWDWLEKFERFTIWTDNDEAGKKLEKFIVDHLGSEKCSKVSTTQKDANDVLINSGKEEISRLLDCAIPTDGMVFEFMGDAIIKENEKECIKSGIYDLDWKLKGFRFSELTVWTGVTGSGKSTLLLQMMIEAVDQGYKVCLYSGEMEKDSVFRKIAFQLAGDRNIVKKINGNTTDYSITEDTFTLMKNFIADKICKTSNESTYKDDEILNAFEYAYRRYNCRVFVVDNLMTVTYKGAVERHEKQSGFITRLKNFAVKYSCHIHLVAHPRKGSNDNAEDITLRDISGTYDIANKADNVIAVFRTEADDFTNAIKLLKNREHGFVDMGKETVGLVFCPASKRMARSKAMLNKKYSWETDPSYVPF